MFTSFINNIMLLTKLLDITSYLINMKSVIIFVIFYKSTHCNNSNYFLLLIIFYLSSIDTKTDAIMLLNYLGFSVLYDTL